MVGKTIEARRVNISNVSNIAALVQPAMVLTTCIDNPEDRLLSSPTMAQKSTVTRSMISLSLAMEGLARAGF